jgi:hypothetical protein
MGTHCDAGVSVAPRNIEMLAPVLRMISGNHCVLQFLWYPTPARSRVSSEMLAELRAFFKVC